MATVTGMTAAAMGAIRDNTVVSASFDSASHLILTKYDGTLIDAGSIAEATTGQAGLVELATSAETQAGVDSTRVVTPAGLASLPGYRVQLLGYNALSESAVPSSWPYGITLMGVNTGSGWTPNAGFGTVMNHYFDSDRAEQVFYANVGGTGSPKTWVRSYTTSGGWAAWAQNMLMVNLDPASFTQSTTRGNYPIGQSRLYYTSATSSAWDFAGLAGEVITYAEDTNTFGRQTFTSHAGGSGKPVQWVRTATASGWTAWQVILNDPGAWVTWTPTWTTSTGTAVPTLGNATVDCRYTKLGRTVTCKFEIAFGSTTNFGSGAGTGDNWRFGLPVAAARVGDSLGFLELNQSLDDVIIGRARTVTSNSFGLGMSTGRPRATALSNTGDVDSISPWTWANGNSIKGTLVYEAPS